MLGNLNSSNIEDILQGTKLIEIRQSIRQGQPHEYCSNCVKAERFGNSSERQWHNDKSPEFDYSQAGDQYHYPVIVDVRWNITCNLSCNYCGPTDSSKWASLKNITVNTATRHYYTDVCKFIEKHYDQVQEVALIGGEPLLLPENKQLLDVIPESAIVTLITNLNTDLQNNKIFQKLAERNRVGWSMSFDNIGEKFEYVRYGGSWTMLQENLKVIQNLMRTQGHWGGVHAVYNIYNATRLCEFRQFVEDTNNTVLWQSLFFPEYLDPFLHGAKVAQVAAAEIRRFYDMGIATSTERQFFDQALSKYDSIVGARPEITQQFKQHIHKIETQYHPSTAGKFARLWPEIAQCL
jgi:sulfatase maturation enzyme AslB (radical SAM superfamily)